MSRIRFRSKRFGELVRLAKSQGFSECVRGSGHIALICPSCGNMTIMSGSQRDNDVRRYQNIESRLRQHGLSVTGKTAKGCQNVGRRIRSGEAA